MTYLETLRRIPDDEFLWIFAGDFDERSGMKCVCGRALQASFAKTVRVEQEDPYPATCGSEHETATKLQRKHGGEYSDWAAVYWGASNNTAIVESAVVDRINEIVR